MIVQSDATPERISQRRQLLDFNRFACRLRSGHGRTTFHGNSDNANLGVLCFQGERDTRNQPTSGELYQHGIEVRHLLQHFQPECALAGDDVGMVERRNHGIAFLTHQALCLNFRLVLGFANDAGFGAERANAFELVARHQLRHTDDAGHARLPRRVGEGAAVVTGGNRGNAAGIGR